MRFKLAVLAAALFASLLPAQTSGTITPGAIPYSLTDTTNGPLSHASRTVEAPGHFYIVDYAYSTGMAFKTLMGCIGGADCNKAHYDATIKVFEIVNGVRIQLGPERSGKYTVEGCFEDDPLMLIEAALSAGYKLTEQRDGFHAWRKKEEARKVFEAMPLYELFDGVLRITERGKRDLKAITVDDVAIWGSAPRGSSTSLTDTSGWTITGSRTNSPAIAVREKQHK